MVYVVSALTIAKLIQRLSELVVDADCSPVRRGCSETVSVIYPSMKVNFVRPSLVSSDLPTVQLQRVSGEGKAVESRWDHSFADNRWRGKAKIGYGWFHVPTQDYRTTYLVKRRSFARVLYSDSNSDWLILFGFARQVEPSWKNPRPFVKSRIIYTGLQSSLSILLRDFIGLFSGSSRTRKLCNLLAQFIDLSVVLGQLPLTQHYQSLGLPSGTLHLSKLSLKDVSLSEKDVCRNSSEQKDSSREKDD